MGPLLLQNMREEKHRLRDSLPIRFGIELIGFVVLIFLGLWVSSDYFHNDLGSIGPVAICAFAAIILALGLVGVGIGQTIVRRRGPRNFK